MELSYPLILDGATGTQLQERGFDGSDCAEAWVLEHPETIREIQKAYVDAGSQILYAPTFGANRVKLEAHGYFNKVRDFNLRLVSLCRQAADGRAYVAGDLAPTGLFLYPLGETSFEELVEIYTEQAAALEEAGVDLFVIETMMTVAEARAALLAVRSVSEKPVFVSFTCDENGRTLTGSDVTAALQILQGMGLDAFGLNCSVGPEEMAAQLRRLHRIARVPMLAKPNAGTPESVGGKTVYDCPPERFTRWVGEMAASGVAVYGGCCGTGAEHIRAIRSAVETLCVAPPDPEEANKLPCATEKACFFLDADVAVENILPCTEGMEDVLEEELESERELLALSIRDEAALDALADIQYMISKPLCLLCEDAGLLEQALRLYQGRALYEGPLPETVLLPLAEKYGLIY